MTSPVLLNLKPAERQAIEWLREHGGDGVFDRRGVALARGELAPVMRRTWNALADRGLIEFYGGRQHGGSGYGRLKLVGVAAHG